MKVAILILLSGLLAGCDVLSEINSEIGYSEAELAKGKPTQDAPDEESAEDGVARRTATWWENAQTLGPREDDGSSDAMVRCKISGGERFTRAADCLTAGGKVVR